MYIGYQNGQIKFYTENIFDEPTIEKWEETKLEYVLDGEEYILKDEAWEEKQAKQEAERIQALYMTRSDFFDGTIQAWGVGQDELLILIQNLLTTLPIENVKKLIAVNNFKNALNFYRKHDLFTMLSNIPIPLTETMQVTITSKHWDKFFDETDKKNPEAFKELPTPEIIIIPEENATPDEGSETNSGDSVEENQSEDNLEKVESNINLDMD